MKTLVAFALLLSALGSAWAGTLPARPVVIDVQARRAAGPVESPGSQRMQCRVYRALGMSAAECWARDIVGQLASCTTHDGDLLDVIAAVDRRSFVSFTWDEGGQCTSVHLSGSDRS